MVVPLSYRFVPMGAGSGIVLPARAAILKSAGKMGEIPNGEPGWCVGLSLDKQFVSRVAHGARRRAGVRTRPYPSLLWPRQRVEELLPVVHAHLLVDVP